MAILLDIDSSLDQTGIGVGGKPKECVIDMVLWVQFSLTVE